MLVEVRTPEALLVEKEATLVHLPGQDGVFEILPNHQDLISLLRAGQLVISYEDNTEDIILISDGFSWVENNKCIILVYNAVIQ